MSVQLENGSERRRRVSSGSEIKQKSPGKGHQLAEVRNRQGLSQRCVANRLGISVAEVREQEEPSFDLTISQLYGWQAVLDVPVDELLNELEDTLLPDVMARACMLRVMKTAQAVQSHARTGEQQRLAADAQREQADLQARMDMERMKNETQLAIAQMKIQADEATAVFHATTKRVGTESQWQYDEEMKAQQQRADKELTMLKGALKAAPTADTTVAVVSTPEEEGPPGYGPGV